MLQPLDRTTLSTQAADRIKEYILSNDLSAGDKLPAEWELAEMLGVSVRVVREAMKSLETMGFVETRPGAGRYVGRMDHSRLASLLTFSLLNDHGQDFRHLTEARKQMELSAVDLAIDKMTPETLERLEQILSEMYRANTIEETVQADHEFHKTLVSASANPLLIGLLGLIDTYFTDVVERVKDEAIVDNPAGHRKILDAVRNRDKATARELLGGIYKFEEVLTHAEH